MTDLTTQLLRMNLIAWYSKSKLIDIWSIRLSRPTLNSKKSVRFNLPKNSPKVREFTKKVSPEKIRFMMKLNKDKIQNWIQMSSLSTSPTEISSNHFMKPSIYKWLNDILIWWRTKNSWLNYREWQLRREPTRILNMSQIHLTWSRTPSPTTNTLEILSI